MKFRLGINYWPSTSAMDWWQRFDAAEVSRDLAAIRSTGFDSVRIFLLWEYFQPQPSTEAVANFARRERDLLPSDLSWIDITSDDFYRSPRTNLQRLYQRFLLTQRPR